VLALREWKLSPHCDILFHQLPHYLFLNQPSRTKNFGADALSYVLELTVDQEQGFYVILGIHLAICQDYIVYVGLQASATTVVKIYIASKQIK
jgi:hypothetical protein